MSMPGPPQSDGPPDSMMSLTVVSEAASDAPPSSSSSVSLSPFQDP